MVDDRVIELIRQLKAISGDAGAHPNEREAAAFHAKRLLEKHQLSLFDLETKTLHEDVVREFRGTGQKRVRGWHITLANQLALAYDCRMLYSGSYQGSEAKFIIIGHTSDVQVWDYMLAFCLGSLRKYSRRDGRRASYFGAALADYCGNYITAAAYELRRRIQEERTKSSTEGMSVEDQFELLISQDDEAAQAKSTALVAVKTEAVEQFMRQHYPKTGKTSHKRYAGAGSLEGRERGKTMQLRKGVRQSSPEGHLP